MPLQRRDVNGPAALVALRLSFAVRGRACLDCRIRDVPADRDCAMTRADAGVAFGPVDLRGMKINEGSPQPGNKDDDPAAQPAEDLAVPFRAEEGPNSGQARLLRDDIRVERQLIA
jgi:hypothetical protein